ncbi:MAG: hypothetical protein AB7E72_00075 [Lysobacterales bacterium]
MDVFTPDQLLILKICAVVIVVGLIILAIDRWIVRADEPGREEQLAQVIEQNALQPITGQDELDSLQDKLRAFEAVTGQVQKINTALLRQEAAGRLWLIEYQSRERSLIGANAPMARVDVPLFAILIEFGADPGWPPFVQKRAGDVPEILPAEFAQRLLGMDDYRLAMQGRLVVFASQLQTAALMQSIQSNTSPEFHPGLLNSALRVDVQSAIDIVNALPGSPQLARFYEIEGIEVKLPQVDGSALSERLRADQERIRTEQRAASEELARQFERDRAEFRRRNEELRQEFRQRIDAANEKLRGSGVSPRPDSAPESQADTGPPPSEAGAADSN